jgi:hypothetical protein
MIVFIFVCINKSQFFFSDFQRESILSLITQYKLVFTEPKISAQLTDVVSSFKNAINNVNYYGNSTVSNGKRNGAILIGVCRGKLSEGYFVIYLFIY